MRNNLIAHFAEMTRDVEHLYEVTLNKDALWDIYLESHP